jgi:multimeric flavodoxin WrbA
VQRLTTRIHSVCTRVTNSGRLERSICRTRGGGAPRPRFLHFGMVVVGLDYGHTGQMTLDEITGGTPYGATTITGGDASRLPTA